MQRGVSVSVRAVREAEARRDKARGKKRQNKAKSKETKEGQDRGAGKEKERERQEASEYLSPVVPRSSVRDLVDEVDLRVLKRVVVVPLVLVVTRLVRNGGGRSLLVVDLL